LLPIPIEAQWSPTPVQANWTIITLRESSNNLIPLVSLHRYCSSRTQEKLHVQSNILFNSIRNTNDSQVSILSQSDLL